MASSFSDICNKQLIKFDTNVAEGEGHSLEKVEGTRTNSGK